MCSYAEYLHTDPALWQISVEYLYSCGDVGKGRADEGMLQICFDIALALTVISSGAGASEIDATRGASWRAHRARRCAENKGWRYRRCSSKGQRDMPRTPARRREKNRLQG